MAKIDQQAPTFLGITAIVTAVQLFASALRTIPLVLLVSSSGLFLDLYWSRCIKH